MEWEPQGHTWEYDLNGNVIRHETLGRDDIEIETWQYNNDGNVTREWKDRNADGTPTTSVVSNTTPMVT